MRPAASRAMPDLAERDLVQHRELAGPGLEAWLAQVVCGDAAVAAVSVELVPGRNQTNSR